MTTVRIELAPDQTPEQAEEELFKAISSQRDGEAHEEDKFLDPAIQHQSELMMKVHKTIYDKMLQEILEVIDSAGG